MRNTLILAACCACAHPWRLYRRCLWQLRINLRQLPHRLHKARTPIRSPTLLRPRSSKPPLLKSQAPPLETEEAPQATPAKAPSAALVAAAKVPTTKEGEKVPEGTNLKIRSKKSSPA